MKTTHIFSSLIVALAIPLLHSCQKSTIDLVEPTQGEETPSTYKLEKPLTVSFLVGPNKQIRPVEAVTRAVGDLSRNYTKEDKENATVNSAPSKTVSHKTPEFYIYGESGGAQVYKSDWIRNIHIPELRDEDYKVTGNIPVPYQGGISSGSRTDENSVVTITFYSLPNDGTLTFLANSYLKADFWSKEYGYLDLSSPFIPVTETKAMYSATYLAQWKERLAKTKDYFGPGANEGWKPVNYSYDRDPDSSIFESAYIPMYGRLYNVAPSANKDKLIGSEKKSDTPKEINTIYLERAVAVVTVGWDLPSQVSSDFDYFVDEVYWAKMPNVVSIVPNNWDAIQTFMTQNLGPLVPKGEKQKVIPAYWDYRNNLSTWEGGGVNDRGYMIADRVGYNAFFVPENLGDKPNTIYVVLSQFDPKTGKAAEQRGTKVFELPYGEKNSETGLLEVHRNTWYNLHIKFKQTPSGVVPYIVDTWEDKPVDIPW